MDKFFPALLKVLAAAASAAGVILAQKLIAFFQGSAPSDVSGIVWSAVSFVAVLVINFLVGKLPPQPAA